MSFISAVVLYKNEEFYGLCTTPSLINSELVKGNPRQAWIYPNTFGYYTLTMQDPKIPGTLTGVWVVELDQGYLLDGTLTSVQNGLSACCSSTPVVVTPVYGGQYPTPQPGVPATYTITRVDDGSISAMEDVALAYLTWMLPNTIQRTSYNTGTGTSTYTFQSYSDPVMQGGDQLTGETARLFLSNTPAALTAGQTYTMTVYVNGDVIGAPLAGATSLAALVTAAQGNPAINALGTYTVQGGAIQLSTTTVNACFMNIAVVGP